MTTEDQKPLNAADVSWPAIGSEPRQVQGAIVYQVHSWRIRMRIHDVAIQHHPGDPEKVTKREVVNAVAIDDGSKVERPWCAPGSTPWATLQIEITDPARFGQLTKGRIIDVGFELLEARPVTVTPDPVAIRPVIKPPGS